MHAKVGQTDSTSTPTTDPQASLNMHVYRSPLAILTLNLPNKRASVVTAVLQAWGNKKKLAEHVYIYYPDFRIVERYVVGSQLSETYVISHGTLRKRDTMYDPSFRGQEHETEEAIS